MPFVSGLSLYGSSIAADQLPIAPSAKKLHTLPIDICSSGPTTALQNLQVELSKPLAGGRRSGQYFVSKAAREAFRS